MYATKTINGFPAIQLDGQSVLRVCNGNWEFANWLCELLNELGRLQDFSLTNYDPEWLRAIDVAFTSEVQHA